ncbi:uncharacterized protein BP5553_01710 [Venustampulla echinocandica]|uniref:FAD dependent oxidoreductase domain-containing protein n=1 Tax=Venustampulla echinocandica TaxID=2656787 RepID=A0A370U1U4_9HELO|nr:uncharacterized protein BP5553_01710 [Venustampulla echinocandica]RDL41731.1 hypothetical protein BP5553_01710 [Venustampulla echinocandica]
MEHRESVGIIGAGITGLATAYILSSQYNVTVVARDMPGDLGSNWASPWAGAGFHPQVTDNVSLQQMQITCFRFYWSLAQEDPSSGVKVYPMTEYFDNRQDDRDLWYKTLMPGYQVIPPAELPGGISFGIRYTALAMNPLLLLPWLQKRLAHKGVSFIRKEVRSVDEARNVTKAKVIVNASGAGAKAIAGDASVKPLRGQTMFVNSDFQELLMLEGSEYTYVIPRATSGGVILGGVKSDRLDVEVDPELKGDILARVNRITNGAFKEVDLRSVTDIVGFRPGREAGLRVERRGNCIHAYGMGGAGYIYSFGVAERMASDGGLYDETLSGTLQYLISGEHLISQAMSTTQDILPANPPFCCGEIVPPAPISTPTQHVIWDFVQHNSDHELFNQNTQKHRTTILLDCYLCDTDWIIEVQERGVRVIIETRYFIRKPNVPDNVNDFVEMDIEMVNWNVWEKDSDSINWMCNEHAWEDWYWATRVLKRRSKGALPMPDMTERVEVTDTEIRAKFAEEEAMMQRAAARCGLKY